MTTTSNIILGLPFDRRQILKLSTCKSTQQWQFCSSELQTWLEHGSVGVLRIYLIPPSQILEHLENEYSD